MRLSLLLSLMVCFSCEVFAQNVGIGTTTPGNKLQVHGNILVQQPLISTKALPTVAQTYTIVNAGNLSINGGDSTCYLYDPGGAAGNYLASLSGSYIVNNNCPGIQITVQDMDLGTGDSVIITDLDNNRIWAVGNGYTTRGVYTFNKSSITVKFTSNADGSLGRGFVLLCKFLFADATAISNIKDAVGTHLGFDAQLGSLSSGVADAAGNFSTAMGYSSRASGYASTALGYFSTASGYASTAIGATTTASGSSSTALGNLSNATGINSTAIGNSSNATGRNSSAIGLGSNASGYASFATGMFNDGIVETQNSVTPATPMFIVGNGDNSSNRSNALVVYKNGKVYIGDPSPANLGTKLQVTGTVNNVTLADNSGLMNIGYYSSTNMVLDQNDIQVRLNGAASDLYLQRLGGDAILGGGGGDVKMCEGAGSVIMCQNGGSVIMCQDGGNVTMCKNGGIVRMCEGTGSTYVKIGDDPNYNNTKLIVYGKAFKANGSSSWDVASDIRLKQNIVPYTDGLTSLLKIKPIRFQYNELSGNDTKQNCIGVLAQELQQISPYMVSESSVKKAPDGSGYLQVDNSAMTYMLINAVKEQQQQIEMMQKEIQLLKSQINK